MAELSRHLVGLYYPSIQFKNDSLVKLAALYWDRLGRIVPPDYPHEDSDVVEQLIQEADFIRDLTPSSEDIEFAAKLFLGVLRRHPRRFRNLYNLDKNNQQSMDLPDDPFSNIPRHAILPAMRDTDLTFIASGGKMTTRLRQVFLEKGLAQYAELGHDLEKLGFVEMHPRLALVYMEVLAEQMAHVRHLYPVTDEPILHRELSRSTVERLTNILLSKDGRDKHLTGIQLTDESIKICLADIAIKSILPRDIADIPTKKIIQLRNKYRDELINFQNHLQDFVEDLRNLQDIKDPATLDIFLTLEYEKKLRPQMEDLRKCLNSLAIDTGWSVLNVRATMPELATSLETYSPISPANPVLTGIGAAGAVAYSVIPTIRKQRRFARDIVNSFPAAYLLHIQEGLEPSRTLRGFISFMRRSMIGA